MGLREFFDNITDPDFLRSAREEFRQINREFCDEIRDAKREFTYDIKHGHGAYESMKYREKVRAYDEEHGEGAYDAMLQEEERLFEDLSRYGQEYLDFLKERNSTDVDFRDRFYWSFESEGEFVITRSRETLEFYTGQASTWWWDRTGQALRFPTLEEAREHVVRLRLFGMVEDAHALCIQRIIHDPSREDQGHMDTVDVTPWQPVSKLCEEAMVAFRQKTTPQNPDSAAPQPDAEHPADAPATEA
ncbi:hypothetical protein LGV61_02250 [Desulfurispirillum indicum]|uniref:hypothetical protein n=1 Tax=Desulfurispirillum indicum TaxID=936456 RepID=UPI001CFBDB66|nr:hypothetical protein [Desulfurispirillum indicum]UCZ57118.1 hypothetical protein LGV61_02250 [Desulfurispirillum indicum]